MGFIHRALGAGGCAGGSSFSGPPQCVPCPPVFKNQPSGAGPLEG